MSHRVPLRTYCALLASAVVVANCSKEPEYTDRQRACIAQRYATYDATKFSQCLDVCNACMSGTTTTCTTSCKLKGAS
jgi:hypothetical protein